MSSKKPYNPNTAYGRRKLREQSALNYANMTEVEKNNHDTSKFLVGLVILIVVGGLIFILSGTDGLIKWLTR